MSFVDPIVSKNTIDEARRPKRGRARSRASIISRGAVPGR